jgi:hypothetical protein
MESSLPRVLMLVLASDTSPIYVEFQSLWRQYMTSHPNIDCYFYKGDPTQEEEEYKCVNNTLTIRIDDGPHLIYDKMCKAFAYFESQLDAYDYVYRPNLSSFIVFKNYLETLRVLYTSQNKPERFCCAVIGDYNGIKFPSGSGFTITPDIVRYILRNPRPKYIEDDVTVGVILKDMGINITPVHRVDILTEQNRNLIECIDIDNINVFHYRLKSNCGNRRNDIENFKKLLEKYYIKN